MTSPQPEPIAPAELEQPPGTLTHLVELLLVGAVTEKVLSALIGLPGVSPDAARALLKLPNLVSASRPEQVVAPDSVRATDRLNVVRRAQYLANAARRLSGASDLTQGLQSEATYFRAHRRASENRRMAAEAVAQAQDRYGSELGWYAQMDSRTSAECRAANGTNFRAGRPPRIGYPGAVHPNCRCRPGKPHPRGHDTAGVRVGQEMAAVNKYPEKTRLVDLAQRHGSLRAMAADLGVSRVSLTNYLLRRPELDRAVRSHLASAARPVELAGPPEKVRQKLAAKGQALPDGGFPIRNVGDLQKAIRAYGRAKDKEAARRLIRKRARELKRLDLIPEAWGKPGITLATETKSSAYPKLERVPGKQNWVDKSGGLPPYIERIAKHLHYEKGMDISRAIAVAVNTVKRWAAGGTVTENGTTKRITAKTQAQAAAALASWEAKKAASHSHSNRGGKSIDLATYSEQQLGSYYGQKPPAKKSTTASKSSTSSTTSSSSKKRIVRTEAGAARYHTPIGTEIGKARNAEAAKAQQNKPAVDKYKAVVTAKDRDAQVKALNNNDLGQLSQVAFSFKSADPQVVALRNSLVGQMKARGMDPHKFGYLGK